jgi:RNA recognition motif-containing protein
VTSSSSSHVFVFSTAMFLPWTVTDQTTQGYFKEASGIARPKKVMLQFGPTGKSLGTATIIFATQAQAIQATGALNGVKIDNRALRVEMLVSAANLPAAAEKPSLADRITYVYTLQLTANVHYTDSLQQQQQQGQQAEAGHRVEGR